LSIKTPRLIRDRCGIYYFRFIVPLTWRDTVKKTELRRSLGTKDAAVARQAALVLSARMEIFVANSKTKPAGKSQFMPEQEQELFGWMQNNEANKLIVRRFGNGDIEVEADTPEERKEAKEILAEHAKLHPPSVDHALAALPRSRCGKNLDQASKDYLDERKVTLKDSTWRKHRGVLGAFIKAKGNLDVAMVSALTITDYKKELLAADREGTTINDHITILNGFFEYCISNKVVNMANPAKGLYIVGAHNKAESYKTFTDAELKRIFQPVLYVKKLKLPDFYWCPLLALFTGARAEELASLDVEQIYPIKGIWVIDILKGKTDNAERRVPIHKKLIDLGFLDYVSSVGKAGYKKLFPNVQPGTNGYRKNMTRMFGVYLDLPEVNVVDPLKVFHSFRHTVVTRLTSEGVNDGLKRVLVGHDIDTRTSSHDDYIHADALTLSNLQKAINKLAYKGISFQELQLPKGHFLPIIAKRLAQQAEQKKKKTEAAAAKKS
jgi:integrase